MKTIKASVGVRNGKQCYNVVADQLVVIGLLNSIPGFAGGAGDNPLPTSPRWGVCSPQLENAILTFQSRYNLPMDGHVDPGGMTILRMNQAAGEQNVPAAPATTTGKVGLNTLTPAAPSLCDPDVDYWSCTNFAVDSLQLGLAVSASVSSGAISFARGRSDRAFKSIDCVQVSVALQGQTPTPEQQEWQKALEQAKSRARKIAETAVKGINGSGIGWPGWSAGPCVSFAGLPDDWRAPLEEDDFSGTCFGVNFGAGILLGGASGWIMLFGMPRWFGAALVVAALAETPTLGVSSFAIAALLTQAKGVAFIGNAGAGSSVAPGASAGQFIGVIR